MEREETKAEEDEASVQVVKGARVRVRTEEMRFPALAGMQMKGQLSIREFVGVVRHIRGDHPTEPTTIHCWVAPEDPATGGELCSKCGVKEIEVECSDLVELLL